MDEEEAAALIVADDEALDVSETVCVIDIDASVLTERVFVFFDNEVDFVVLLKEIVREIVVDDVEDVEKVSVSSAVGD